MDCTEFLSRYSEYDDSLLPRGELSRFRAHMQECASCDRYDRVLRKGRMLARQVAAEPAPDFVPRLRERLLADRGPRTAPMSPVLAGGVMTLLLAAVAGLWIFETPEPARSGGIAVEAAPHEPVPAWASRPLSLPVTAYAGPADWTRGGVDRRRPASYSPLVIGPPAYRGDRSITEGVTSATSHTLD